MLNFKQLVCLFVIGLAASASAIVNSGTCSATSCQNNGTCQPIGSKPLFRCVCPAGYVGAQCQQVDPCATNPCLNNGYCVRYISCAGVSPSAAVVFTAGCQCSKGYSGPLCATAPVNNCVTNPCQNGGSCQNQYDYANLDYTGIETLDASYYTCQCTAGKIGVNCQYTDPCSTTPTTCMNNGMCPHRGNNYYWGNWGYPCNQKYGCSCSNGYAGVDCSVAPPAAYNCATLMPCQNAGVCTATYTYSIDTTGAPAATASYTCKCATGYLGNNCQYKNPCIPTNPCAANTTYPYCQYTNLNTGTYTCYKNGWGW